MKAVKKMLAAALAAAVAVTCVLPAYAAGSDIMGDKPVNDVGVISEPSASGVTATVNTSEDGTAKLDKVQKTNKKSVKVSQKVEVNGVKYTVTIITADAFAECEQMTDVTIPSTVTKIAKGAFRGADSLKEAEIKGKPVIKAKAFSGAKKLKKVTFTNSPTAEKGAFRGAKLNKLVVNKKGVFKKGSFEKATVKKLVVNKNTVFEKGAFTGNSTKNSTLTVSGKMSKKKFNNFVKMMRAAGFKGEIRKK